APPYTYFSRKFSFPAPPASASDPERAHQAAQAGDRAQRSDPPRARVLGGYVLDGHQQMRGLGIDLDAMNVASNPRISPNLQLGAVRADAGERQRGREAYVGRKAAHALARAAREQQLRLFQADERNAAPLEIRRADEPRRRLARDQLHGKDCSLGGGPHRVAADERTGRHEN